MRSMARSLLAVAWLLLPLIVTAGEIVEARLDKQLAFPEGVVLRGLNETRSIPFTVPTHRELNSARVMIRFRHSTALIEPSTLTVAVNGTPLRTVRLTAANAEDGTLEAAIPPALLKEYSRLELLGAQHYTTACEDPFEASLWTAVLSESRLIFDYGALKRFPRLDEFPQPVADILDYREPSVRFVIPRGASAASFGAAAGLAGALGRHLQYRTAQLRATSDLDLDAGESQMLIGTFAELEPLPGAKALIANGPAGAGAGYLRLVESGKYPGRFIVIVSGTDQKGLRKAARALSNNRGVRALAATEAVIQDAPAASSPPRKTYLPLTDTFTLRDLPPQGGLDALTVHGINPGPITIRLSPRGDERFVRYEQRLRLEYAYGPQVDTSRSTVEVLVNGHSLRGQGLNQVAGSGREVLDISIPHNLLGLDNTLQVSFHLYPRNWNYCEKFSNDFLWATVSDTSRLSMPRDHYADLPDLALLGQSGYPLAGGPTAFVLPAAPQPGEASLLLAFAFWLGQVAGSAPDLAYFDSGLPQQIRDSSNLVAVGTSASNSLIRALADRLTFYSLERNTRLRSPAQVELSAEQTANTGFLEETVSPWAPQRTVVVVSGSSPDGVRATQAALMDAALVAQVGGNLVLFPGARTVYSFDLAPKQRVGSISLNRRVKYWVTDNSAWFFLASLAVLITLFFLARFLRRRYFSPPVPAEPESAASAATAAP